VAVLLEAARRLAAGGLAINHRVYFVAAGAEELDHMSSRTLFADPSSPLANPLGIVCLNQVGQACSYYLT